MDIKVLENIIASDVHDLLNLDKVGHYRIYGRINGQRGGAFFGFEDGIPIFGGGNLIHAPVWWNCTCRQVFEICDKIKLKYPDCEADPDRIND